MKVNSLLAVATFVAAAALSQPISAASDVSLQQRIELLEQQNQTRNQIQSDMSLQLIDLHKSVKELRGIIEEHEYKLQQIQDRQRDLYRDIDNRLSAIPKSSSTTQTSVNPTSSPTTQSSTPAVANSSGSNLTGDERSEFEAAFNQVRNKEYTQAIKSFEGFLKKHPRGAFSDNARFWIGQVYFAQSKFDESEKQFALLRTEFPESTKLSTAMLKQAEIKVKQQKWEEAKTIYNQVVEKYTGAQQQLARKGLQDIKSQGH